MIGGPETGLYHNAYVEWHGMEKLKIILPSYNLDFMRKRGKNLVDLNYYPQYLRKLENGII